MKFLVIRMILLVVFASTIVSCTKDDDPEFTNLPEIYPLNIGNTWDYDRKIRLMYKDESTAVGVSTTYKDSTIELSEVFSEAVKDTVLEDSIHVVIIKSEETAVNGKQDIEGGVDFYMNKEDGFYEYIFTTIQLTDVRTNKKIRFRNQDYNSIAELKERLGYNSLIKKIKDSKSSFYPFKSIEYPIEVGNEWDAGSVSYTLNKVKKVIGTGLIEVPAGDFDVYEIQTFWDWGLDGEWDQDVKSVLYLSKYGFVKTRFELWNLARTDEFNNIIDYFDVFEEEVLIDYDVK
ncbi:MAG: hypothetical protein PHF33_00215 [Candidatus Delongbacteria bacterium]|nr:hypothetical protein [Candidatus Delongbacteria bacterium]MDD4205603.1 hypothetical protein [Candidatus Delongbacteria bacterium]